MNLENIIQKIRKNSKDAQIVILPRDDEERKELKEKYGNTVIITEKAVDGPSLISFSDLVISGSGTMNREAVVLGVPVISTYPHELLAVDEFFVKNNFMVHDREGNFENIGDPFKKLKLYKKNNNGIKCLMKVITNMLGMKS